MSLIRDLILGIVGLPAVLFRCILCDDSPGICCILLAVPVVAQQIGLSLGTAADCWCRLVLWLVTFQQPMAFIRANGSLGSQPSLVRFVQYCKLTRFSDSYSSILHTTWWLYYVKSRWNHSKNNRISLVFFYSVSKMSTTGILRGCRDIKIYREHAKYNQCKLKNVYRNHSINSFLILSSFNYFFHYFGTKAVGLENTFQGTNVWWLRPEYERDKMRIPENYWWDGFVQKRIRMVQIWLTVCHLLWFWASRWGGQLITSLQMI